MACTQREPRSTYQRFCCVLWSEGTQRYFGGKNSPPCNPVNCTGDKPIKPSRPTCSLFSQIPTQKDSPNFLQTYADRWVRSLNLLEMYCVLYT